MRFFKHFLLTGGVVLLIGCSGPEPKEEPSPAGELKASPAHSTQDAPPLGGARSTLLPDELLEGVEGSTDDE